MTSDKTALPHQPDTNTGSRLLPHTLMTSHSDHLVTPLIRSRRSRESHSLSATDGADPMQPLTRSMPSWHRQYMDRVGVHCKRWKSLRGMLYDWFLFASPGSSLQSIL